jgi:acyl-CoA thioesterase FadM
VDYLLPTPLDGPIEIRGKVKEFKGSKVVVESILSAGGKVCARGELIAVQVPEEMMLALLKK